MRVTQELKRFLLITGTVLFVLGAVQLVLGGALHDVTGAGLPASDSDTRFAGGYLLGSGLVWIHAARQTRVPATLVRLLAAALLLGGVARLLSLLLVGYAGPVVLVQTVVEIVIPLVVVGLLSRSVRDGQQEPA